jgi:hypothetical protein
MVAFSWEEEAMSEWLHSLSLGHLAMVVFAATYLVTAVIYIVVMALAVGERARAFKALSPGMLPPLGIVFGLFVAFVAAQVWADHDRANAAVNREASALSSVMYLAASFPGYAEMRLRELTQRHIREVVNDEWPKLARNSASLRVTPHALAEAMQFTLSLKPQSGGQVSAQRELVAALENAIEARQQRIIVSRAQVHGVKWICLVLQAVCTLIAIAMVHNDNRGGAGIALTIFATGVAVAIVLVAAHDRPFGGPIAVKSDRLAQVLPEEVDSQRDFDHTIALHLTGLLHAAREVISERQDAINQRGKKEGLTARQVIEAAQAGYARVIGQPLPVLDPASAEGRLLQAELEAIREVMDEAQPLINDPDRDFKGFIPAIFAYRVADRFSQKVGDVAYLKLTAPAERIRHQTNLPDAWEDQVIKKKFQAPGWEKGRFVAEEAALNGKKAYRLLIPEYYVASCLGCHGEPKGAKDITGGKKEGARLGELGGSISVAIYLK